MIEILNLRWKEGKAMSDIVRPLLRYAKSPETNFVVADKAGKMSEIEQRFKDGEIDWLDGITRAVPPTGGSTSAPATPSLPAAGDGGQGRGVARAAMDELVPAASARRRIGAARAGARTERRHPLLPEDVVRAAQRSDLDAGRSRLLRRLRSSQ